MPKSPISIVVKHSDSSSANGEKKEPTRVYARIVGEYPHDIITVVRDPEHTLGKRYVLSKDGGVDKSSNVKLSFGIAVQRKVTSAPQLKALLEEIGNDTHAAIINSYFPEIPVGEEFAILSTGELASRRAIDNQSRDRLKGVHPVERDGKIIKGVCRLKENMRPSSWVLIDRDVDEHTPDALRGLDLDGFLAELNKLVPGIKITTAVVSSSSSSRVFKDGHPVSAGNAHLFIKVADPEDLDRARSCIIPRAVELEMAWTKPKYSRTNPAEIVARSWATLIDQSVWTAGRLVFCGKPTGLGDLEILPPSIDIRMGLKGPIDTAQVDVSDVTKVSLLSRQAGAELNCSVSNGVLTIKTNDLKLDTLLNTQRHGVISVRDVLAERDLGKRRCQAPFRVSESWAAFLNVNADGIPFVYDSGTNITHWLNQSDHDEAKKIAASHVLGRLLADVKDDSGSVLEPDAIDALAQIKKENPAEYQRKRLELKKANSKVPLTELDQAIKNHLVNADGPSTHHGYAEAMLKKLAFEEWKPVVHNGVLHVVDSKTMLWRPVSIDALQRDVARTFDGQENCHRTQDYKGIASHAISLAEEPGFFDDAPVGVATPGGFYCIDEASYTVEALKPEHKQRFAIDMVPSDGTTPLFDKFLSETFASANPQEEEQQIALVQEVSGAVMLGLMPKHQKAVVFYDPYGRAGKGTVERILRRLVPKEFVTAVSPFSWGSDYHVATLATSRLNVVGELPDNKPIPAADFKTVLGGDLITGRHPTHRPISFSNEAAHVFMSNHMIHTSDHSEAFFARWSLLEFPNSLIRSGKMIDTGLADRIIASEMPGIAYWALQGATRLLAQGQFSESMVHDRLMADWRRNRNSFEQFIHERCKLSEGVKTRRSDLYRAYRDWCNDVGKKPFSKAKVKDLIEHTVGMKISLTRPNGIETFNGVEVVEEGFSPLGMA